MSITEFTTWGNQFAAVCKALGIYRLWKGEEEIPKDPRPRDEDGELLLDENNKPLHVKSSKMKTYKKESDAYEILVGHLWYTIYDCCQPDCASILKPIEIFDFHAAWNAINVYFNNTATSANYMDAKVEFEAIVWRHSAADDSIAFDELVSSIIAANDVLDRVHNKPMDDDDLILEMGRRLPDKYAASFSAAKRLTPGENTFRNAVQHIKEDIKDTVKRENQNGHGGKKSVDISNLAKADKKRQFDNSNHRKVKFQKNDQSRGRGRNPRRATESAYLAEVPLFEGYKGCLEKDCKSLEHMLVDCPINQAKKALRHQTQNRGRGGGRFHSQSRFAQAPQQQYFAPPPPAQYQQQPVVYRGGGFPAGRAPNSGRGSFRGRGWPSAGRFQTGRGQGGADQSYAVTDDQGFTYLVRGPPQQQQSVVQSPHVAPLMYEPGGHFAPTTYPQWYDTNNIVYSAAYFARTYFVADVSLHVADARVTPCMFVADSGSTKTHCNEPSLFKSIDFSKTVTIRIADDTVVSTSGVGSIGSLNNVCFTPKFGTNLLSVSHLSDLGYDCLFKVDSWCVLDAKTMRVKGRGIRANNLYWIDPRDIEPPDVCEESLRESEVSVPAIVCDGVSNSDVVNSSFVSSTKPANNSITWHQRLHCSDEHLAELSSSDLVIGLKLNKTQLIHDISVCPACTVSKIKRRQFRSTSVNLPPLQFFAHITSDVEGPIHPVGINGERYIVSFIDVLSDNKWIYTMKSKDECCDKFLLFKQEVLDVIRSDCFTQIHIESRTFASDDFVVIDNKRVLTDGGREYLGQFEKACLEFGYHHKVTAPYTPEDNPVSERYWQSLMGLARTFLQQSNLPLKLWPYAVGHANWIYNRTLITTIDNVKKTPHHWIHGQKPDFSNLRSWGCEVIAHIPKISLESKLSDRGSVCYFMGSMKYAGHNTVVVYCPEATTAISYHGHVLFNEIIVTRRDVNSGTPYSFADQTVLDDEHDDLEMSGAEIDTLNVEASNNFMKRILRSDSVIAPVVTEPVPEVRRRGRPSKEELARRKLAARQEQRQEELFAYNGPHLRRSTRPFRKNNMLNISAFVHDSDFMFGNDPGDDYCENSQYTNFCHELYHSPTVDSVEMNCSNDVDASANNFRFKDSNGSDAAFIASANRFRMSYFEPFAEMSEAFKSVKVPDWYNCEMTFAVTNDSPSINEVKFGRDKIIWNASINEELLAHLLNGTWTLARIPYGRKALKHKWVFKIKMNVNGDVLKLKSRLVAAGYSQIYGIDYDETFSPVANLLSIRLFFALCAQYNLDIRQMDVNTAFLNADLVEEIYMDIPEFYDLDAELAQLPIDHMLHSVPRSEIKCRLNKALYGLKQSPRQWNENIDKFLRAMGYEPLASDPCLYFYCSDLEISIIAVYVDDVLIAASLPTTLHHVVSEFNSRYKMEDKGEPEFVIGIKITRDRALGTITLDQGTYIEKMLEKFQMSDCVVSAIPADPSVKLTTDMCPTSDINKQLMSKYPYRELVGSLMYAMVATRPEIAYAVSNLSKFLCNPGYPHWHAGLKVLRYLRGTTHKGITYRMNCNDNLELFAYSDSDWAGCRDTRRSHSGGVLILAGGPICWLSKRQPSVTMSSAEAEYAACQFVCRDVIWVKGMLNELNVQLRNDVVTIFTDSTACIAIASKPIIDRKTKHIEMYYHFLKERVAEFKDIALKYIGTDFNIADMFTKALNEVTLTRLCHDMYQHSL